MTHLDAEKIARDHDTQWHRIRHIFESALEIPAEQRDTFLSSECNGDAEIRLEIESLLLHERQAGEEFLLLPPIRERVASSPSVDNHDHLIGQTIADFTIKQPIACGGMATVYLAEQANPQRDIALKVLHSGFLTKSIERRFGIESRILAYMRHPNIAQVYAAGKHRLETGASVHFIAMEFVPDATPITRYASDLSLSLNERLELVLHLCDAVNHGHQKGIIHRDLKPANILVDSDGRVKVIDFGIARSTDSDIAATTMHTETGQLLGTLAYMSPEQCAADPSQIDTTTDIYSLGVILYELVTRRMPYDVSNMTIHSAARVICEKEPTRPSAFNRVLRGDLETIILKAIEKDRAKRYQSAAEVASDIRRYIIGEPISAHPPTPWVKLLRWAIRHSVATTAILCAFVGLFMLASVGVTYWVLARQGDRVEVELDGRQLVVYSMGGLTLHRWTSAEKTFAAAAVAERPAQFGGGRIALVAVRSGSDQIPYGGLFAYNLNGPFGKSLWSSHIESSDMPHQLQERGLIGGNFGCEFVSLYDVFPDNPGDEIVTVFGCRFSHCAMCIFSLDGTLLYRVWQDGGIYSVHWLADAGLLVCAGADEAVKNSAQQRGQFESPACRTVFAVRPTMGIIRRDYLKPDATEATLRPIWYKYLWPLRSNLLPFYHVISPPQAAQGGGSRVSLSIQFDPSVIDASLEFTIDQDGRELPQSRIPNDVYNQDQAQPVSVRKFPPPEVFQLRDDPPTDSWPVQSAR